MGWEEIKGEMKREEEGGRVLKGRSKLKGRR